MTGFTDDQKRQLGAKLDAANVKTRQGSNGKPLSYVEGWHAIAEANRIFGFDGWNRGTVEMRMVSEREVEGKWRIAYVCKVRVTVWAGEREIVRDGTGYGSGIDRDAGTAHEKAVKEAETDAMKRALMTFGNPFGLALYDKELTNVEEFDPRAAAADVRNAIDAAEDLVPLNRWMANYGEQPDGADPTPDSILAKIRANSEQAYQFLIDRANKRRGVLAQGDVKKVA